MYEIRNFYKELEAASRLATEERWLYEQMRLKNTGGYQLSSGSMISNGATQQKFNESLNPNLGSVRISSPDKPKPQLPPSLVLADEAVVDELPPATDNKGKAPEKPKAPNPPSNDPDAILQDLGVVPTPHNGRNEFYKASIILDPLKGSFVWNLTQKEFGVNNGRLVAPNKKEYPMTTGLLLLLTQSGPKGIAVLKENHAKIDGNDIKNYVEIINELPVRDRPAYPSIYKNRTLEKNHIEYIGALANTERLKGISIAAFKPYNIDHQVGKGVGLKRVSPVVRAAKYKSKKDLQKRIAVLKGEIQAGNNSKRVYQELLELVNL